MHTKWKGRWRSETWFEIQLEVKKWREKSITMQNAGAWYTKTALCFTHHQKNSMKTHTHPVHHHLLNRLLHILNFLPLKTIDQHHLREHNTVITNGWVFFFFLTLCVFFTWPRYSSLSPLHRSLSGRLALWPQQASLDHSGSGSSAHHKPEEPKGFRSPGSR